MTKETILEYFKDINYAYNECTRYDDLSRMLDELMEQMDEDCISRKSVIDVLTKHRVHFVDMVAITSDLKDLPSVQPKPKTGHWITFYDRWGEEITTISHYKCSECGNFDYDIDDYCPNCGARMVESEGRNDKGIVE